MTHYLTKMRNSLLRLQSVTAISEEEDISELSEINRPGSIGYSEEDFIPDLQLVAEASSFDGRFLVG